MPEFVGTQTEYLKVMWKQ